MTARSIHLPIYTSLVGLLLLSVGFNIVAFEKINKLTKIVDTISSPVSDTELRELMNEVKRLSEQTYLKK